MDRIKISNLPAVGTALDPGIDTTKYTLVAYRLHQQTLKDIIALGHTLSVLFGTTPYSTDPNIERNIIHTVIDVDLRAAPVQIWVNGEKTFYDPQDPTGEIKQRIENRPHELL